MPLELTVPSVGESVTEVEVGDWLKQEGDPVRKDEAVVVLPKPTRRPWNCSPPTTAP
ncbi:MAG: lipoyl domain-containing protein [Verrucomicrobia bacterium]|nr:lipoyl domain-containing protein [Verrucomicrobiota bacterium]